MSDFLVGLNNALLHAEGNELEVRFKNLSRYHFDRFLKALLELGLPLTETSTVDRIGEGRVRESTDQSTGEKIFIRKKEVFSTEVDPYGLTISVSREIPVEEGDFKNVTVTRTKHRYSFRPQYPFSFDLTETTTQTKRQMREEVMDSAYEVEIELLDPAYHEEFRESVKWAWTTIHDSPLLYHLRDDPRETLRTVRRPPVSPLRAGDLNRETMKGMYITRLVPGKRRYLLINQKGVWLVSSDVDSSRLASRAPENLWGTLLDGVFTEEKQFVVFDCLVNREGTWANVGLLSRLVEGQKATEDIRAVGFKSFTIATLSAERCEDPWSEFSLAVPRAGFFDQVNGLLDSGADGIIIRKGTEGYNFPVIKWQRPEDLSVDLLLTWELSPQGQRAKVSPNVEVDKESLPQDIPTGSIVRFSWNGEKFVFSQVRYDKQTSDKDGYVKAVVNAVTFPLTEKTLRGYDSVLVRYHLRDLLGKALRPGSSVYVSEKFKEFPEIYSLGTQKKKEGAQVTIVGEGEDSSARTVLAMGISSTALSEFFRPTWGMNGNTKMDLSDTVLLGDVVLTPETPTLNVGKMWEKKGLFRVSRISHTAFLPRPLWKLAQMYVVANFSANGVKYEENKTVEKVMTKIPETTEQRCFLKSLEYNPRKKDANLEELDVPWGVGIYRIATIGDDSCFAHAILKGISDEYEETRTMREKSQMACDTRNYLADLIEDETTYRSLAGGLFHQSGDPSLRKKALQKLLRSKEWLGEETFSIATSLLGFSLLVVMYCKQEDGKRDLELYNAPYWSEDPEAPVVVILATTAHYETLGIEGDDGIMTRFPRDHPFVEVLLLPRNERKEFMDSNL